MKDSCWHPIDKIRCCMKSFPPKEKRQMSLSKKIEACFNNVPMFPFNYSILMMSIWTTMSKMNTFLLEKGIESYKLTPQI